MIKIVSTGSTISSPEFHKKKLKARKKKAAILSLILFFILVASVFLLRLESLRLKEVAVYGAHAVGADVVESEVREVLAGYYLFIIPRNNVLIYPGGKIEEELKERHPRFSAVDVAFESMSALAVTIEEREPSALYCIDVASSSCYFLDKEGFIFDQAPAFSDGVYFVYTSEGPIENPRGYQFLPVAQFQALSVFIGRFSSLGLEPRRLEATENYHRLVLSNGARVVWHPDSDYALLYSNLETFLNSSAISTQGDFWSKVAELDLRTPNKVFYSFKESN